MMRILRDQQQPPAARRLVALRNSGLLLCLVCGCSSKPAFEFDKLDLVPVEEGLTEFSLGKYTIPIPTVAHEKTALPFGAIECSSIFSYSRWFPHERNRTSKTFGSVTREPFATR